MNERFNKIKQFFIDNNIKYYFRQSKLCRHGMNFHLNEIYYVDEYSFYINQDHYILQVKTTGKLHFLFHKHREPEYPAIGGGWSQKMVINDIKKKLMGCNDE